VACKSLKNKKVVLLLCKKEPKMLSSKKKELYFLGGFFNKLVTNAVIGIQCLRGKSNPAAERKFKQRQDNIHKKMWGKSMYK
jgi:ribosomal protein L36